jgi:hypothetical protein
MSQAFSSMGYKISWKDFLLTISKDYVLYAKYNLPDSAL